MNGKVRIIVADDELSRLIRTVDPLGQSSPASLQSTRKPIEVVLEELLLWFCDGLTGAGWPDPTALLEFREGEWTGEIADPLQLLYREQETDVEYVRAASAIRYELESEGLCFGDTWYCAAMVENLLSALAGAGDQRLYAMISVGWFLRDWEWRRKHGKRVRTRLGSDRGHAQVRAGGQRANSESHEMRLRWVAWAKRRQRELLSERPGRTGETILELIHRETATRELRVEAVGVDCEHDLPRRRCFVCSRPSKKTLRNNL